MRFEMIEGIFLEAVALLNLLILFMVVPHLNCGYHAEYLKWVITC